MPLTGDWKYPVKLAKFSACVSSTNTKSNPKLQKVETPRGFVTFKRCFLFPHFFSTKF